MPLVSAHDQVRQPIAAAQQPLLRVVVEPPLRLLHARLNGQCGGAARLVELQRRLQLLYRLLLTLRELLRLLAWGEPRDVGAGGERGGEEDGGEGQRGGERLQVGGHVVVVVVVGGAADDGGCGGGP